MLRPKNGFSFRSLPILRSFSQNIKRVSSIQQEIHSQSLIHYFEQNGKLSSSPPSTDANLSFVSTKQTFHNFINVFLPKGYPSSIEKGYLNYSSYQFLGYLSSTAGSVLSTQSLLYALGLGDGAIPLAATLNWIIKDGFGQFGGVLFASLINNQFDQNPKRWRMISATLMDFSSLLELLTPLAPKSFLLLASFANIGKNISYLSASASRVAIHKSFTLKHENLADLTAKTGSQTILSSLLGTSLGIYLSTLVNHSYPLTMTAFLLCSAVHLSSTVLSLRTVTINTLSLAKLEEIFGDYLTRVSLHDPSSSSASSRSIPTIITPEQYSSRESLFPSLSETPLAHLIHTPRDSAIIIGADISEVFSSLSDFQVTSLSSPPFYLCLLCPHSLCDLESSRSLWDPSLPRDDHFFHNSCSVSDSCHTLSTHL
jgi:hypothetical protein